MGEEKVNSVKEDIVNTILLLFSFVFLVCGIAYVVNSIAEQANILVVLFGGMALLTIGCLCFELQSTTRRKEAIMGIKEIATGIKEAIDYIRGKDEEKKEDGGKKIEEEKVIFVKEDFWKVILKACGLAMIASVFFAFGAISILQSNLSEALSSSFVILCILLWRLVCFAITRKMTEKLKKM